MSEGISSERIGLDMQQCEAMAVALSDIVEADSAATGHQYDVLLTLPRGSFMPANVLSRRLGFGALDIVSGSVTSYVNGETEAGKIRWRQRPTKRLLKGKNVLVVDEISDTGETLADACRIAYKMGALSVKTAVLVHKPGPNTTGVEPDFFVKKHNGWVDFYWEEHDEVGKRSVAKRKEDKSPKAAKLLKSLKRLWYSNT